MADGAEVLAYLREQEFLVEDSGLLMIGPRAEKEFGKRHFMDLLSTFVADLELRVMAGIKEIGFVSPLAIPAGKDREQRPLVLAGRGWLVQHVDWERFTVWVEEIPTKGDVEVAVRRSHTIVRGVPGEEGGAAWGGADVELSMRVPVAVERLREERAKEVDNNGLVLRHRGAGGARLWTWAGLKANATLLAGLRLNASGVENESVLLPEGVTGDDIKAADSDTVPRVDEEAISGLKFSVALPSDLAIKTLGERLADPRGAGETTKPASFSIAHGDAATQEELSPLGRREDLLHATTEPSGFPCWSGSAGPACTCWSATVALGRHRPPPRRSAPTPPRSPSG